MSRKKAKTALIGGDGRKAASVLIYVRPCEQAILISNGWGCDDEGSIEVYKFLHYPDDAACEMGMIYKWTEDREIDCLKSVEIPRVRLTRANKHDIINEEGVYLLARECGADDVTVYYKYEKINGCCK